MKGEFWLPESPSRKVDGDFEIIDGAVGVLILYDSLVKNDQDDIFFILDQSKIEHSLILGYAKRRYLALKNPTVFSAERSDGRITLKYEVEITLKSSDAIDGCDLDSGFNKISFTYHDLNHYIGSYVLKRVRPPDSNDLNITCEYHSDSLELSDSLKMEIEYNYNFKFSSTNRCADIAPVTSITIESSAPKKIEDWFELIDVHIGAYLSFISGRYICPKDIVGYYKGDNEDVKCGISYSKFNRPSSIRLNKRNCISFQDDDFKLALKNFFALANQHPLIIKRYYTLYYNKSPIEDLFINAVNSLEIFERKTNPNNLYIDENQYEEMYFNPLCKFIEKLSSSEDDRDLKKRLQSSLEHSNEPSLFCVIDHLIKSHKGLLSQLDVKTKGLAWKITNTRHWYTHHSDKNESNALKGYDLADLYINARRIFEVCLFKYLEMPDNLIVKTVKMTYP